MEQARDGGPTSGRFAGLKVALETIGVIEHDIVSAPLRPLNPAERATVVGIARSLSLS
jgi:dihydrodipicolinate synthase/N-acetylneuraminate lyase